VFNLRTVQKPRGQGFAYPENEVDDEVNLYTSLSTQSVTFLYLVYILQISALYGAMYLLEIHVASVGAVLLPVLTDFLSKKLTALTG